MLHDSPQQTNHERRSAPRKMTFLAGKIILPGRKSTFDCRIVNLSMTGALLKIPNISPIPEKFMLKEERSGRELECQVVMKRAQSLAVTFLPDPTSPFDRPAERETASAYSSQIEEPQKRKFIPIPCIVSRNSNRGVVVEVDPSTRLPEILYFREPMSGDAVLCRVIYRLPVSAGISFLDAAEADKIEQKTTLMPILEPQNSPASQ